MSVWSVRGGRRDVRPICTGNRDGESGKRTMSIREVRGGGQMCVRFVPGT
jgi:hypothetical protein